MNILEEIHLSSGSHEGAPWKGACIMEAVSLAAGEDFGDMPSCVAPEIRRVGIRMNDGATDEQRQDLRPFIPRVIGTAGDGHEADRIAYSLEYLRRDSMLGKMIEHVDDPDLTKAWAGVLAAEDSGSTRESFRALRSAAWRVRDARWGERRTKIKEAVKVELEKQGKPAADAAAAADAAVDAAADAAAAAAADAAVDAAAAAVVAVAAAVESRRQEIIDKTLADLGITPEENWQRQLAFFDGLVAIGEDERTVPQLQVEALKVLVAA